jgi:glycosyltransferase involved in cell wall biosynthesis
VSRPRVLALSVGLGLGGAEKLLRLTVPRLRARGYDMRVAGLKGTEEECETFARAGAPCLTLGATAPLDPRPLLRLHRLLRRERIDILHAHCFLANVAARLVGRLAGTPVVIAAHHDTDVWMGATARFVERQTARLGTRVVACSEAVRLYAIERHGLPEARVVTLRNAIAPQPPASAADRAAARTALGAAPEDRLIGTLGRLDEPKKGLRTFLAAAARVAAAEPRARFVLIGKGPARGELERRAASLGLRDRVRFHGEAAFPERLLPGLDLLAQPSLWEGFGLSVVEAMAAGVPVVASKVGGIPEAARDDSEAVLVPPGDAPRLAEAIVSLLRDPARAARLGAAGRRRAIAEFSIERLVEETAALYDTLLPRQQGVSDRPGNRPGDRNPEGCAA